MLTPSPRPHFMFRSRSTPVAKMPNPVAVFDTTLGTIKCTIFLDEMPITGSNFIDLAKSGFYNGLQ